MVHKLVNM